jgi:hypothetical protein
MTVAAIANPFGRTPVRASLLCAVLRQHMDRKVGYRLPEPPNEMPELKGDGPFRVTPLFAAVCAREPPGDDPAQHPVGDPDSERDESPR